MDVYDGNDLVSYEGTYNWASRSWPYGPNSTSVVAGAPGSPGGQADLEVAMAQALVNLPSVTFRLRKRPANSQGIPWTHDLSVDIVGWPW
jgi:hypothetical protein